jgi:hypothetical protein
MGSFPSIDLTNFDLAPVARGTTRGVARVGRMAGSVARDITYTTVGLSILTVQRAQVRRRELHRALNAPR